MSSKTYCLTIKEQMMLFHNEWFVTKICFYQNDWTVYQLSSSLELYLGWKGNEGVYDSSFGATGY